MDYKKINLELAVFSEDALAVVAELNSALDRLEDTYTIFGGSIEATPVEHSGTRRKSALKHTLDAGMKGSSAVKLAAQKIGDAYKKIIRHQPTSLRRQSIHSHQRYGVCGLPPFPLKGLAI
jgi:hypothetical protein